MIAALGAPRVAFADTSAVANHTERRVRDWIPFDVLATNVRDLLGASPACSDEQLRALRALGSEPAHRQLAARSPEPGMESAPLFPSNSDEALEWLLLGEPVSGGARPRRQQLDRGREIELVLQFQDDPEGPAALARQLRAGHRVRELELLVSLAGEQPSPAFTEALLSFPAKHYAHRTPSRRQYKAWWPVLGGAVATRIGVDRAHWIAFAAATAACGTDTNATVGELIGATRP